MNQPRDLIQRFEKNSQLPRGDGEILSVHGVESCPFASGDVLCSRHVLASSMNLMGSVMPDALWKNPTVLAAMAPVAGVALGAGKRRLTGRAPNGQRLIANPLLTWTVPSAKATIDGRNLGAVVPLRKQSKLGDF
jgi:hypothetical protein